MAVLLIDMIKTTDFEGEPPLHANSTAAVDPILWLRDQADAMEAPTVYVSDFGLWNSERSSIIARSTTGDDRIAWTPDIMRKSMGAETRPTGELSLEVCLAGLRPPAEGAAGQS